jgi:hypothetical protein
MKDDATEQVRTDLRKISPENSGTELQRSSHFLNIFQKVTLKWSDARRNIA